MHTTHDLPRSLTHIFTQSIQVTGYHINGYASPLGLCSLDIYKTIKRLHERANNGRDEVRLTYPGYSPPRWYPLTFHIMTTGRTWADVVRIANEIREELATLEGMTQGNLQ